MCKIHEIALSRVAFEPLWRALKAATRDDKLRFHVMEGSAEVIEFRVPDYISLHQSMEEDSLR